MWLTSSTVGPYPSHHLQLSSKADPDRVATREECKWFIALCNIRLNYAVNIVADHKLASVPDQPTTSNVLAVMCRVLTLSGDP